MKKTEQIYREILYLAMEQGKRKMTQLELSQKLGISLSTVHLAVERLARMGSVKVGAMSFSVLDTKKILYLWASVRNVEKDVLYQAHLELPVREIERALPDVGYAAYSAYKLRFKDVPADYSEVYVYASQEELKEIQKRVEPSKGQPNFFVLRKDENLTRYGNTGTVAQIFVDVWNMKQWYAADFVKAMEVKL